MKLLTEADTHNPLWLKLKEHLESRLQSARCRNDGFLNSNETERLRGRIAEMKYLLDQAKPGPAIEADAGFD